MKMGNEEWPRDFGKRVANFQKDDTIDNRYYYQLSGACQSKGKKNRVKSPGFSLIELIIAIAILVILTGLLAPRFMRYIEKSRESVCRKNMDEMLNIYRIEHVSDEEYLVQVVVDKHQDTCPSSGKYEDYTERLKLPWIMCTVHDEADLGKTRDVIISNKLYNAMLEFVLDGKAGNANDILKLLKQETGKTYISNDTLREYLYKKFGGWSTVDKEILKNNGIPGDMYIQPYLNMHLSGGTNEKRPINDTEEVDVILFAKSNGALESNWNATLIYNPNTEKWFKGPKSGSTISVFGKKWPVIEAELGAQGWQELK